jgi:hypothetical protein
MKQILLILIVILAIFSIDSVLAAQPTQQYSKIYLKPFYQSAMTAGTNYSFNVTLNPSDGISRVDSAMVSFQIYIVPTVTFYLWVQNDIGSWQSCTPPSFLVHTTYMDAGYAVVSFDCSNVITHSGTYKMRLQPSGANTGAVYGWLDLTYMNNPPGSISLMGTEYKAGDEATVFLQLTDAEGNPVNNGNCYVNIWYPKNASGVHPLTISNAPMLKAMGNSGLYYYDLFVPELLGIYMLTSSCYYSYNWQWIYPDTEMVYYPNRQAITGTWTGSPIFLNSYSDDQFERCDATTAVVCQANYTFNVSQYGNLTNVSTINMYFSGQGDVAGKVVYFAYWNGTAFVNLGNTWTTVATGATATIPGDTDSFVSNSIPLSAIRNLSSGQQITIRITTPTGLARYYHNWLSLAFLSQSGMPQVIQGSNEIHVNEFAKETNRFFTIDSCNGYVDGRCASFVNDTDYDLIEGELDEFINVTATISKQKAEITYATPFSVDCSALYWIKYYNGTNWTLFDNYSTNTDGNENCIITLTLDTVSGTDYKFWLKLDNYMKWEVEYSKEIVDTIFTSIDQVCANTENNYTVPITDSILVSDDPLIRFCHFSYDDKYWFDNLYDDSTLVDNAGEYSSFVKETRFYRTEIYRRYMYLQASNISLEIYGNNAEILQMLNALNSTASNIYTYLNTNISNRIDSISASLGNAINNQSVIFSKLVELQGNVTANYNLLQSLESRITSMNSSLILEINQNEAKLDIMNNTLNLVYAYLQSPVNSSFGAIQDNLSDIMQRLSSLNYSINNLNVSIGNVSVTVDLTNVTSGISQLNASIGDMRTNFSGRFDTLSSQSNSIKAQVDAIEWKLDCNNTINIICDELSGIKSMIISVNSSVNNINISPLTDSLNNIFMIVSATNLTVNGINSYLLTNISPAITSIQAGIYGLGQNNTNLYAQMLNISSSINTNYAQLQIIQAMVANTNTTIFDTLSAQQAQLSSMNITLQNVNTYLVTTIGPQLTGIQGNITLALNDLSSIQGYVDTLEPGQQAIFSNLSYIQQQISGLNLSVDLSSVNNNIANVKAQVDAIEWKLDCNNTINIVCDKLDDITLRLDTINSTTINAYSYLQNNMSSQLQSILSIVTSTNSTLNLVYSYLQGTVYPAINSSNAKLDELSLNQTNIYNELLLLQGNLTNQYAQLQLMQAILLSMNSTITADMQSIIAEINQNEAKLDLLNLSVYYIIGQIDNSINPALTSIQSNISDMQADLNMIYLAIDTLEAGQSDILSNISALQAYVFGMDSGINGRFDLLDEYAANISLEVGYIEAKLDCNHTINIICTKLDDLDYKLGLMNTSIYSIDSYLQNNVSVRLNAVYDVVSSINGSVDSIAYYLNGTVYPAILNIDSKLDLVLMNTTNIWEGITTIQANLTSQNVKLDYLQYLIQQLNLSQNVSAETIIAEINQNEAKLDNISSVVGLIYSEILTIIEPKLDSIQSNISVMQAQLDELNDSNQLIFENLSNIYSAVNGIQFNYSIIQQDIYAMNSSLQDRFNSTDLQLAIISSEVSMIEAKLDCNNTVNIVCDKLDEMYNLTVNINQTSNDIEAYLFGPLNLTLSQMNLTITQIQNTVNQMNQTVYLIYYLLYNVNSTNPPEIIIVAPTGADIIKKTAYLQINYSVNSTSGFLLNYSKYELFDEDANLITQNETSGIYAMDYNFEEFFDIYNLPIGDYYIRFSSKDLDGRYSQAIVQFSIINRAPLQAIITSPAGGSFVNNITVNYSALLDLDADFLTATFEYSKENNIWAPAFIRHAPYNVSKTCALSDIIAPEGNFTTNGSYYLNKIQLVFNQSFVTSLDLWQDGLLVASSNLSSCTQNLICEFRFENIIINGSYYWNLSSGILAGAYACNSSSDWLQPEFSAYTGLFWTPPTNSEIWDISGLQPWLDYWLRVTVSDGVEQAVYTTPLTFKVIATYGSSTSSSSYTSEYMYCNKNGTCYSKEMIERQQELQTQPAVFSLLTTGQTTAVKEKVQAWSDSFGVPVWFFILLVVVAIVGCYLLLKPDRKNKGYRYG